MIFDEISLLVIKKKLLMTIITIFGGALSFIAYAQPLSDGLFSQEVIPESVDNETCQVQNTEFLYPYTQLKASQFQRSQITALPPSEQTIHIICSAPVVSLMMNVEGDLQADSVVGNDASHFGLGMVNGTGRLGYYQVKLTDPRVDEQSTRLYQTPEQNQISRALPELLLQSSVFQGWSRDGIKPDTGQHYSVKMTVQPFLYSLQETNGPLVSGAELNGELVLSFPFSI